MIYVTGDTHGEQDRFQSHQYEMKNFSSNDILIVCGDFGYIFRDDNKEQEYLEYLSKLPFRLLFVDGNHENFDKIYSYPIDKWCGGKVHIIRRDKKGMPKVIHLMRGQVFVIEEKKFFTFGGAYSIDKGWRQRGYSWWCQEMPTDEEMKEAIHNLEQNQYNVDYIITHTAPEDTMCLFHPNHPEEKQLNNFLEWIRENTTYKHWYFGHLHEDRDLWRNQTVLWYEVRDVDTNRKVQ